jgi:hypothetical protein
VDPLQWPGQLNLRRLSGTDYRSQAQLLGYFDRFCVVRQLGQYLAVTDPLSYVPEPLRSIPAGFLLRPGAALHCQRQVPQGPLGALERWDLPGVGAIPRPASALEPKLA